MQWDIFCKVIDNFGDVGVCWRLVRALAARGHTCRLWIDDASALRWMAPHVSPDGCGHKGIQMLPWPAHNLAWPDTYVPGEVVIEAFGCHLPETFVARMQRPLPPIWINLEYFSAEAFVERSHGLISPVLHGPGQGLKKYFFYPGLSIRTGGLLRSTPPIDITKQDDVIQREAVLRSHGIDWHVGERIVNVFCYDHAPLLAWLDALHLVSQTPCHILLMQGAAQTLGCAWNPPACAQTHIKLHALPAMPQPQFDELLTVADLNIVRGEDSAVSALWAGRPHLWHIYPQNDLAHVPKLEAFMDHWMHAWPETLRTDVQQLWRAFNGLAAPDQLKRMITLWSTAGWTSWQASSRSSSRKQTQETDLITRLLAFVAALSR